MKLPQFDIFHTIATIFHPSRIDQMKLQNFVDTSTAVFRTTKAYNIEETFNK